MARGHPPLALLPVCDHAAPPAVQQRGISIRKPQSRAAESTSAGDSNMAHAEQAGGGSVHWHARGAPPDASSRGRSEGPQKGGGSDAQFNSVGAEMQEA